MSTTYRRQPVELLVYLFGCTLVGVATVHAVWDSGPVIPRVLELATITTLSLSFLLAAVYMAERLDDDQFVWVVYSTVGLGLLTGTLSWVASAMQRLQGYSLNEPVYYGLTMMAGGAAAGPYVGYFYGQLQQRNAELNHRFEEMSVLNRRLSVANRVLRHNLRNNLTVISGVTADIKERTDTDDVGDRIDMLDRQASELTELSATMGEIRSVWNTNERTAIDLVDLVDGVLADLQSDYPEVTVETSLPESAAVAVHPKLESALREVLTNAVQHNEPSTLVVDVDLVTNDETVTLRVSDSGTGFPDIQAELFAETTPTTSALDHGVGLGLWLVYWTVEKSGGSLSVSNDDGAVVELELPREEGDGEAILVRPTQTLQRKRAA